MTTHQDAAAVIKRWERFGGTWAVLDRARDRITVALCRCDGEQEEQFVCVDPELVGWLGDRTSGPEASGGRRPRATRDDPRGLSLRKVASGRR